MEKYQDYNTYEKINFIFDLYDKNQALIKQDFWNGLILQYIEVHSSEVLELHDEIIMMGAVSAVRGLFGSEVAILILSDIIPEKFRRYVAIHETVETVYGNHWYAIQDEFKAAQDELSKKDFLDYCTFRLEMHRKEISTIKKIRQYVSPEVKKILSIAQKDLGIVLRNNKAQ